MGNRANVQFRFGADAKAPVINLYSHWNGTRLTGTAVKWLNSPVARCRWDDASYLTRIVVHNILDELADPDDELGFGLSYFPDDNEHKILVLDVENRTYELGEYSGTWEKLCQIPIERLMEMAE